MRDIRLNNKCFESEQPSHLELYIHSFHALVLYITLFCEVQGVDIVCMCLRCTCRLYLSLIIEAYICKQKTLVNSCLLLRILFLM